MIENSYEPTLNIVRGNDAYLSIRLTLKEEELQGGQPSSSSVDFFPSSSSPVMVVLRSGNKKWSFTANVVGCIAGVTLPDTLPSGLYSLEILCKDDSGNDYRYMRQEAVRVVESTAEACLDPAVEFDARCRYITAEFLHGGGIDPSNYYTKEEIDNKGFLTQHQDISGKADLETNTRRLLYMQSAAIVLASINGDISDVSSYSVGDIFFSEDTEKLYLVSSNGAKVIGEPDDKLIYFDLGTSKLYRYDLSQGFVEIASGGSGAQVQSDWDETDTSSPAYIKHKPTIPTAINGKSAYQIAQDNGFTGTEAEWLASLHGQDGADGQDGQNGQDGHDGQDGQNGVDGQDGADGKSAYQSYLDTTTDSPKKTEAQWVASLKGEQGNNGFSVNETSTAIVFTVWQGATIEETATKITISA